jgi:hypothetical protein
MVMLVDSGSSHTFVSVAVADQLTGVSALSHCLSVKVANGARVQCDTQLLDVVWYVQGYRFHSDFKVLPLQHFDVVIGYDWLEHFSPMQVH